MLNPFLALSLETARLGFEAQQVMALRMLRFWSGHPGGRREAERMVSEKLLAAQVAAMTAATALATGQSQSAIARKVIRGYGGRVRANRRRLTR